MHKLFWLFFALILSPLHAIELEIRHSEPMSYLHFLSTGFGESFTSQSIKEIIDQSKSPLFKDQAAREQFESFKSYLYNGYNYHDETPNRPEGFWADDALKALASNASDMPSFEKQLSIFLPYRGIVAYHQLKDKFYPLFQELIWKPSLKQQSSQVATTNEVIKQSDFVAWIGKAKKFYRSDYPDFLPFKIALIPIPDQGIKNKHTSATSLKEVQIVPYLMESGVKGSLDVVFHEFCHALYDGQSAEVKNEIDSFYLKHSDPHALFAYRYLNEILATAWGNGLYQEVLLGKLKDGSWYTVKYIDQMAKALLPLMKEYLSQGKNLDRTFMEQTIALAKKQFPDANRELETNLMSVKLFIGDVKIKKPAIKKELHNHFRIQSLSSIHVNSNTDLEALSKLDLSTNILVSSNATTSFDKIKKYIRIKPNLKAKLSKEKSFLLITNQNNRYFFWINVQDLASLTKIISELKKNTLIPDGTYIFLP